MKNLILAASILLVLAAFVGCSAEAGKDDASQQSSAGNESSVNAAPAVATVGQPAPDFTLTDVNGTEHSLSDFAGKYVVLEWINFDCPFVRKHYHSGNMQLLQAHYREQGVVWLSICSSAPGKQGHFEGDALTSRMASENWSGDGYLIDHDGTVGHRYDAKTTPHMYVINPQGVLIYAGAIDDTPSTKQEDIPNATNWVQAALDASMAGNDVATKATKSYGCSVKY